MSMAEPQSMQEPAVATETQPKSRQSVLPPLILLSVSLVGGLAILATQLVHTNSKLDHRTSALEKSYGDAKKVRGQFDTLVKGVMSLAEGGDADARRILDALKKSGVKVGKP